MRKLFLLVSFISLFISCTNDDLREHDSIVTDIKPYISPQMQDLINIADTSKGALPLEAILPCVSNKHLLDNNVSKVMSRVDDDAVVLLGYDDIVKLYSKRKTYISREIAERYNIKFFVDNKQLEEDYPNPNKPYYVTCYAIVKSIKYSTPKDIIPDIYVNGTVIGINPDSLNNFGYHVEDRYKHRNYVLTTYVWSIVDDPDPNTGEGTYYYPQTPKDSRFVGYIDLHIFADHMQWKYAAYDI
jgi:hypothetical protein